MKSPKLRKYRIKPKVTLRSNVYDEATQTAHIEIRFMNVDGKVESHLIERQQLRDQKKLREVLDRRNAVLPKKAAELQKLLAEVQLQEPKKKKRLAAKVGWQPGNKSTFVRHPGVSGDRGADRPLSPPMWVQSARHRGRRKGTLSADRMKPSGPSPMLI